MMLPEFILYNIAIFGVIGIGWTMLDMNRDIAELKEKNRVEDAGLRAVQRALFGEKENA